MRLSFRQGEFAAATLTIKPASAAVSEGLVGIGDIHRLQGRYGQAGDHYGQAPRIAHAIGGAA